MRAAEADGETVPVELLEVDSPDALHPAVPLTDGPGPSAVEAGLTDAPVAVAAASATERRRRRAVLATGCAVLVGLAGVGVGVTVLDARRAQERWDALAELGVPLVDLAEPLTEVWRAEGAWLMTEMAGAVLVQTDGSAPGFRAVDLSTGATRWELDGLANEWCQPWDPSWEALRSAVTRGEAVRPEEVPWPSSLVCASSGISDLAEVPRDTTSDVRVVDVATGSLTASFRLDGRLVAADPVAGGLVVSRTVAGGDVVLARLALPDGAVEWERRIGPPVGQSDPWLWTQLVDGVVHLNASDGTVLQALDARTGEDAAPVTGAEPFYGLRQELADGTQVEVTYDTQSGAPEGTVRGPDGEERFRFTGELWTPLVVDGSPDDPLLVLRPGADGGLVALDPRTGETRWRADLSTGETRWRADLTGQHLGGGGALQLGGVVVGGMPTLAAFDLATGERLWEVPTDVLSSVGLVTDGSRLAVPVQEGAVHYLAAVGLRSGLEEWRIGVDAPAFYWQVMRDGTVLAQHEGMIVAYR